MYLNPRDIIEELSRCTLRCYLRLIYMSKDILEKVIDEY